MIQRIGYDTTPTRIKIRTSTQSGQVTLGTMGQMDYSNIKTKGKYKEAK